jgi:uncharacterized circularly permuted ATP-grasp superfamily protein
VLGALGAGIADDKAIYLFVPDMVKFYLGEEPILKNVPTWRCAGRTICKYVLEHLKDLVVKASTARAATGMLIGPHATKNEIDEPSAPRSRRTRQVHRPADAGAVDLRRPSSTAAWRRAMSTCGPSCLSRQGNP